MASTEQKAQDAKDAKSVKGAKDAAAGVKQDGTNNAAVEKKEKVPAAQARGAQTRRKEGKTEQGKRDQRHKLKEAANV